MQPTPVPVEAGVGEALITGPDGTITTMVVVVINTPDSTSTTFWTPDGALKFANDIREQARQTKSGQGVITTAGRSLLDQDGNPL